MPEFYEKYRQLFLFRPLGATKSYAKQYLEGKGRIRPCMRPAPGAADQQQYRLQRGSVDRFRTEVLPQIERLNRQNERHMRGRRQVTEHWEYSANKISTPARGEAADLRLKQSVVQPRLSLKSVKPEPLVFSPKPARSPTHPNPEQPLYFKPLVHQPRQPQTQPQTQPPSPYRLHKTRLHYGYPQVNDELISYQYQNSNEFMLQHRRLQDIKWLEGHHPRGYANDYREALLRRNQGKRDIDERRKQLRLILGQQTGRVPGL